MLRSVATNIGPREGSVKNSLVRILGAAILDRHREAAFADAVLTAGELTGLERATRRALAAPDYFDDLQATVTDASMQAREILDSSPTPPRPGNVAAAGRLAITHSECPELELEGCGRCPHFPCPTTSYSLPTIPVSACFRGFPVFSGAGMQFESHIGHSISPRQRGFCFNLYTPYGRVPLTVVRGLWPGRRGGLCRCVGDRFGVLASGPAACCGLGLCGSSVRFLSGCGWLANACSWLWDAGTT